MPKINSEVTSQQVNLLQPYLVPRIQPASAATLGPAAPLANSDERRQFLIKTIEEVLELLDSAQDESDFPEEECTCSKWLTQ